MEKIWLKQYPSGVPADIKVDLYPSLLALLDESLKQYGPLPAYKFMGRSISFTEVTTLRRRWRPGCRGRAWCAVTGWR